MIINEKPISYYLEYLANNPTSALDAPTITLLLQAFRGYLLDNLKTKYVHNIYVEINDSSAEDTRSASFMLTIINESNEEFNSSSLKEYLINNTNYENKKFLSANGAINYDTESGYIFGYAYKPDTNRFYFEVRYNDGVEQNYISIPNADFENGLTIIDNVLEVK